jgi:4-oxalocrotonate tautomerase
MPIVTVEASAGRTIEQKRGLVKDITDAVVKNYKVSPDIVTIVIREIADEHLAKAGVLKIDR